MPWREAVEPVRMQRVALVAPRDTLRDVLVRVADSGAVELDHVDGREPADERLAGRAASPRLAVRQPDLPSLEREQRTDLLTGEAQLARYAEAAVARGEVSALAGWAPSVRLDELSARLAGVGAAVVPMPAPRGVDPPTMLHSGGGVRRSFTPLVQTYATVPYADVDPTMFAGFAYVFMFGMMFGDAGHGALLVLGGLLLAARRLGRVNRYHRAWPFVVGAGLAATGFGVLYGEFFGPTGVLPVLWVAPMEEPGVLLAVALGVGTVLLAGAYVLGTVNRWREGGWAYALCAPSGLAGVALFAGLGLLVLGLVSGAVWLVVASAVVGGGGLALAFVGLLAAAGGGGAGIAQAVVELFDAVVRLGANLVSFARLAAFGLTHAALGQVIWDGTTGLWHAGGVLVVASVLVFCAGNAVAFALEALVAGVQALRLEYYELFSRVFAGEGRPFRPWHVPVVDAPDELQHVPVVDVPEDRQRVPQAEHRPASTVTGRT